MVAPDATALIAHDHEAWFFFEAPSNKFRRIMDRFDDRMDAMMRHAITDLNCDTILVKLHASAPDQDVFNGPTCLDISVSSTLLQTPNPVREFVPRQSVVTILPELLAATV